MKIEIFWLKNLFVQNPSWWKFICKFVLTGMRSEEFEITPVEMETLKTREYFANTKMQSTNLINCWSQVKHGAEPM